MRETKIDADPRQPRRLTKSRFRRALECPTKLYYADRPQYANTRQDDTFLQSLADGGFQVGALAQCYFPEGILVSELDSEAALARTAELMKADQVVLFEAAFAFKRTFIRADIVVKDGSTLRLYEVKAKSWPGSQPIRNQAQDKKGQITLNSSWAPYVYDLAFQTFVLRKCFPSLRVEPYLYLADTTVTASVDGLNQRFKIVREAGRTRIETRGDVRPEALGTHVLKPVHLPDEVDSLLDARHYSLQAGLEGGTWSFEEMIDALSATLDAEPITPIGPHCKHCEFKATAETPGLSGFDRCWAPACAGRTGLHPVFQIWRLSTKDYFADNRPFAEDLTEHDLRPPKVSEKTDPGLAAYERRCLQLSRIQTGDQSVYLDRAGLAAEMAKLRYPLHFIDFETITSALPFHAGLKPYSQIAFQFSHHQMEEDGRVAHRHQFLHRTRGEFPNFVFVRELKKALESDGGSIFRYAPHENTVLNAIHNQLFEATDEAVPDRQELMAWIRSITKNAKTSGPRCMVDMLEWVIDYYYAPAMGGSNSLKAVLPATLGASAYLQQKYAQPVYGTPSIPSLGYRNHRWIERAGDQIIHPYHRLERAFEEYSTEAIDAHFGDPEVVDGGTAMLAYSMLQFGDLPPARMDALARKLFLYCELDTFAMVMVFEAWREWIRNPATPLVP